MMTLAEDLEAASRSLRDAANAAAALVHDEQASRRAWSLARRRRRHATLKALADGLESSYTLHSALQGQLADAASRIAVSEHRLDDAERVNAATRRHVDIVQRDLADALRRLEGELVDLTGRLHPALGTDPSFGLEHWEVEDQQVIGFRANSAIVRREDRYREFEDAFRGTEAAIMDRQRVYVPLVERQAPLLDIGCGRGEFLTLMAELGITARGIDMDPSMVQRCVDKELDVVRGEGIDHLLQIEDENLGCVFACQVIEHMGPEALERLLDEVRRVLRPGGLFIAETVNPHALVARTAFWLDRTHHSPVFPEVALAAARAAGFEMAYVFFPGGRGDFEQNRMNSLDYALVASRAD